MKLFSFKKNRLIGKPSMKWMGDSKHFFNMNNRTKSTSSSLSSKFAFNQTKFQLNFKRYHSTDSDHDSLIKEIQSMGKKENEDSVLQKFNLSKKEYYKFIHLYEGKFMGMRNFFSFVNGGLVGIILMRLDQQIFFMDFLEQNQLIFLMINFLFFGNFSMKVLFLFLFLFYFYFCFYFIFIFIFIC